MFVICHVGDRNQTQVLCKYTNTQSSNWVKFEVQFLFLPTYLYKQCFCLTKWPKSREGTASKAKFMKSHRPKNEGLGNKEEFLSTKLTEPINWSRASVVRKWSRNTNSVTWVTSSKMLTSKSCQLTVPYRHTTLPGNAIDLLAQSGAKKVGLCLQDQAKVFTLCSGIASTQKTTYKGKLTNVQF